MITEMVSNSRINAFHLFFSIFSSFVLRALMKVFYNASRNGGKEKKERILLSIFMKALAHEKIPP